MPSLPPVLGRKPKVAGAKSIGERGTAASRGYDHKWRAARLRFLAANPLCIKCLERGRTTAATIVDHIIPHRGNKTLFWDESNWQPLCEPDHNEKTAAGQ